MRKQDFKFMSILAKLAEDVDSGTRANLAACIVYKNQVVSFGFNQKKSHPFQVRFGKNSDSIYLHAETDAIKNAIRKIDLDTLRHCTLYVYRAKKPYPKAKEFISGKAKPCEGCAKAISTFGIGRVVWSEDADNLANRFSCTN